MLLWHLFFFYTRQANSCAQMNLHRWPASPSALTVDTRTPAFYCSYEHLSSRVLLTKQTKQTSWLFTYVVQNLNSGPPRTNPASVQGGTWIRPSGLPNYKNPSALTARPTMCPLQSSTKSQRATFSSVVHARAPSRGPFPWHQILTLAVQLCRV